MQADTQNPAPPVPPDGPSDWAKSVQGNRFSNIQRLGRWIGGKTSVPSGSDPSSHFAAVTPGSLGAGGNPPTLYVVAHGWAPGYRSVVDQNGGDLLWWSSKAKAGGRWASDWAWSPVAASSVTLPVNATGLLQSIVALDPTAIVLAYSWIDDSATDSGDLNLYEVYRSEAYTHANGIRLANALEQAIASSFWNAPTGLVRLIGHSHGSKVATVAAQTLQQRGRRVAHLTVLDAPESDLTLFGNGANLLGFYLEQIHIANPSSNLAVGTFVENYASYFGVGYAGKPNLQNLVEVTLNPYELYPLDDAGDKHTYAAAWYGGAAKGATSQKEPPLGLAWPPPPKVYLPALNQNWPTGTNAFSQWQLQAGPTIGDTFSYSTQPLAVTTWEVRGNVHGDPSSRLIFNGNGGAYSIFKGSYDNSPVGDGYGMVIDLEWVAPQTGDYLVVTMGSPDWGGQEVLFVLDGQSVPAGRTSVAINSAAGGFYLPIYIYFRSALPRSPSRVALSNFRLALVESASGYLKVRRLQAAAERQRNRPSGSPTHPGNTFLAPGFTDPRGLSSPSTVVKPTP